MKNAARLFLDFIRDIFVAFKNLAGNLWRYLQLHQGVSEALNGSHLLRFHLEYSYIEYSYIIFDSVSIVA